MWQLNEIWPTGGWGSLEYGSPVAGQVFGGRWKILHNFLRQSSFADVFVGCGIATSSTDAGVEIANSSTVGAANPLCYIRNDLPKPFTGELATHLVAFATGKSVLLAQINVSLEAGTSSLFCPDSDGLLGNHLASTAHCGTFGTLLASAGCTDAASCYLDVKVVPSSATEGTSTAAGAGASKASSAAVLHGHNEMIIAAPFQLRLPPVVLSVRVLAAGVAAASRLQPLQGGPGHGADASADAPNSNISVEVRADRTGVAAFVWLTTRAAGRFEPNGFMMSEQAVTVTFIPFQQPPDLETLTASLRVEHLGEYLASKD